MGVVLMGIVLTSKLVGVVPDEPRPFASSAEPLSINYNESLETRGQVHGMEDGRWTASSDFL